MRTCKTLSGQHPTISIKVFIFISPLSPPACLFPDDRKTQEAIKASQLCLRLLETSTRDELRRLLTFMATAAQSDACRLQKQVTHTHTHTHTQTTPKTMLPVSGFVHNKMIYSFFQLYFYN